MPTFIKTGVRKKIEKGFPGWLNLDELIQQISPSFTGGNGITVSGNTINLGGILTSHSIIYTGSSSLIVGTTDISMPLIVNSSLTYAIYASSHISSGILSETSSASKGGIIARTIGGNQDVVSTGIVVTNRKPSGSSDGLGVSIDLGATTSTLTEPIGNRIISKWTNVINATRTSEFSITGVNSATDTILLTISGAGIFTLTQGLGNFADDAAAAIGGIPINGLYRTASAIKIRVS